MQLIEQKQVHNAEHGAKYYGLSEYGIYQLFLKRMGAIIQRKSRHFLHLTEKSLIEKCPVATWVHVVSNLSTESKFCISFPVF
jgi:hypothetical protein